MMTISWLGSQSVSQDHDSANLSAALPEHLY
jgi:hypothetical protein